jgi:hypothetical protein
VIGDVLALQQRDGVLDGSGSARDGIGLSRGFGGGCGQRAEPAALDDADDGSGVGSENRRATLPFRYRMAEEKDFGGGGGFFELCGFVGKDMPGGAVFAGSLKALGVLEANWVH